MSLTPEPNGDRTREVVVAQEILQTMGLRSFTPLVTACPGCGRTTSTFFQELADKIQSYLRAQMPVWKAGYPGVEEMKVAVMGCVVNGPGESKLASNWIQQDILRAAKERKVTLAEFPVGPEAPTPRSFVEWRTETIDAPGALPDLSLVAIDGDEVVGWSGLLALGGEEGPRRADRSMYPAWITAARCRAPDRDWSDAFEPLDLYDEWPGALRPARPSAQRRTCASRSCSRPAAG